MSQIAIQTEGIWKRYRIEQEARPHYQTLRDLVARSVSKPFQKMTRGKGGNAETSMLKPSGRSKGSAFRSSRARWWV